MTTKIIDLEDEDYNKLFFGEKKTIKVDNDTSIGDLLNIILDMSLELEIRVKAIEIYYSKCEAETIELLNKIAGMYQFSGSIALRDFLFEISTMTKMPTLFKLECAINLLEYEEFEDSEDNDSELKERNAERRIIGYNALNLVCKNLSDLPSPCRINAIFKLLNSKNHFLECNRYFCDFIGEMNISCDYRYKTIISLESLMCSKILYLNRKLQNSYEILIEFLENKIKEGVEIEDLDIILNIKNIIKNSQISFINEEKNSLEYKIISGQYLLQKCNLLENEKELISSIIEKFASDKDNEYNKRADAADVLIRLGSENYKIIGRKLIKELGLIGGDCKTIFNNAQNVHTEKVEQSVMETLEFLAKINIIKGENGDTITFNNVKEEISKLLLIEQEKQLELNLLKKRKNILSKCEFCKGNMSSVKKFCSDECKRLFLRNSKIMISLNRINIDNVLYSKFNCNLSNILLKIWSYISSNKNKEEMLKRLIEELEEMAETCSSGYATRLINSISGFGEFNISISWEDQIVSNFMGRLNALSRNIINENSIYYTKKLKDVVMIWLNSNIKLKEEIINDLRKGEYITENPNTEQIINHFLSTERDEKVKECVETFAIEVINEMSELNENYSTRLNFSLFFRTSISIIREEMYLEFKDLITDTDFDLYFRKAIFNYEGMEF
jgi:hypothetical protein